MPKQPLSEVFGFPVDNDSPEAERYRQNRLCPYNNKVPNCTKDSVTNPLGICSIFHGEEIAITCPVRLRQDWIIADHAAAFFFDPGTKWTTLLDVRLKDKRGRPVGNVDVLVIAYNGRGDIVDYGGLQVLTPFFSAQTGGTIDWSIASQTFFSWAVLRAWGKKQAVALQSSFYNALPELPTTESSDSDLAWLVYDLQYEAVGDQYAIRLHKTVHTKFDSVIELLTPGDIQEPEASIEQEFVNHLYTSMEQAVVT